MHAGLTVPCRIGGSRTQACAPWYETRRPWWVTRTRNASKPPALMSVRPHTRSCSLNCPESTTPPRRELRHEAGELRTGHARRTHADVDHSDDATGCIDVPLCVQGHAKTAIVGASAQGARPERLIGGAKARHEDIVLACRWRE
jgi:hypothetical protein